MIFRQHKKRLSLSDLQVDAIRTCQRPSSTQCWRVPAGSVRSSSREYLESWRVGKGTNLESNIWTDQALSSWFWQLEVESKKCFRIRTWLTLWPKCSCHWAINCCFLLHRQIQWKVHSHKHWWEVISKQLAIVPVWARNKPRLTNTWATRVQDSDQWSAENGSFHFFGAETPLTLTALRMFHCIIIWKITSAYLLGNDLKFRGSPAKKETKMCHSQPSLAFHKQRANVVSYKWKPHPCTLWLGTHVLQPHLEVLHLALQPGCFRVSEFTSRHPAICGLRKNQRQSFAKSPSAAYWWPPLLTAQNVPASAYIKC